MRRMNNLITFFTAMTAFFFGCFLVTMLTSVDECPTKKSGIAKLTPHPELFLVILILSAPQYSEKRKAIRDTWLQLGRPLRQPYYPEDFIYLPEYNTRGHLRLESVTEQSNRLRIYLDWLDSQMQGVGDSRRIIKIQHFFAIGMDGMSASLRNELKKEHKAFNDILFLPRLRDSYTNLTEKLLHSVDALTNHYDFSYLLKTDDDTYVKLDHLLNELVSYDRKLTRRSNEFRNQPLPQIYWGYFNGRANIKSKGQWSETNYYLANRYITYALGGGYVISRKLCEFIASNSQILSTYVSEDISLGTWLSPLRYVYRRHDPRFDTGYMPRKCRRYHILLHKRNETLMHDAFDGRLCSFEFPNEAKLERPLEYYYNWQKSADKCCDHYVI